MSSLLLTLGLLGLALAVNADLRPEICTNISDTISGASNTYYLGSFGYTKGIAHWAASSTQQPLCVVEPATAEDVGKILKIVGSTQTPFAVKGGGHTSNPGFSSTEGVHISLARFAGVQYDASSEIAVVGAGAVWDTVYEVLEEHGRMVVGGRVTGVGVAGFTLGGGYSWLSNQRGLTVDNLQAYELVKPTGEVAQVTQDSDPDLFFALKGGLNNYGIVTKFYLDTFPQGQVWGGLITFTADQLDKVDAATVKFAKEVTDPKAAIITTYNFLLGSPGVSQLMFYDGPEPPAGIFDDFLDIPHFTKDVDTRSFLSLVLAAPANATAGQRGYFNTVPLIQNTEAVVAAVRNESKFWGSKLSWASGTFISYDVEPFLPSILSYGAEGSSSYPPKRDVAYSPLNIYWAWAFESADDTFYDAIKQSSAQLTAVAKADGQDVDGAAPYVNYALYDTKVEDIYGDNLGKMREVKKRVDPAGVMALAGGFKI
ncbi:FAD-binding domain-containing protein [Cylindrobasidium torrendii FP15055 ss-10]|uniref:FAD-binding domain-containing protein n=1 Tax=Cylindrobasidium torrendii FP15055 ss-10 TaxID=1314674 RepID=A0A0D7B9P7_9AGAR|nr:FAD-binding domain-containing protein [Cylindrobasidium torrendii FP15055 ss-10]